MDLGLKDRVYVVTGATRGLGNATARQLVADGAKVVVTGRDEKTVTEAAAGLGPNAAGVAADNADPAAAGRLVLGARTLRRLRRRTDQRRRAAARLRRGQHRRAMAGRLRDGLPRRGAARRAAAAELGEGGVIAFVLSGSVYEPIAGLTISNGLRPGLAGFAKSLADEVGPRGIRVVGVLPGRIATDRMRQLDGLSPDPEATRAANEAGIPLRRYGTPEEFGRAAAFLLSPAASYVTGVMLPVDGGARSGF